MPSALNIPVDLNMPSAVDLNTLSVLNTLVNLNTPLALNTPVDLNTLIVLKASLAFILSSPYNPNYVDLTRSTPPLGETPALPIDNSIIPHLLINKVDTLSLINIKKIMMEYNTIIIDLDYRF